MKKNNFYLNLLLIVILILLLNCNLEDKNNEFMDKTKQFLVDNKQNLLLLVIVVSLSLFYYYNSKWVNNLFYNEEEEEEEENKEENEKVNYDQTKLNSNITVIEEVKPNITLYYADWCPHCNTLKPIWNKFYEKNKNNNKYEIKVVDCTESCSNPDIEGYPTILVTDSNGNVSDFAGEIKNEKDLENYIATKLQ